jgi:hypothetical protein
LPAADHVCPRTAITELVPLVNAPRRLRGGRVRTAPAVRDDVIGDGHRRATGRSLPPDGFERLLGGLQTGVAG